MEMNEKKLELKGKRIIITGGRSGLGFAMAQCIAASGGFPILLGSSSQEVMEDAARRVGAGAGYHFDVTETEKAAGFIRKLADQYGSLDGLINNAGVHCKKNFEDTTEEDFARVLAVHVTGAVALTRAVIPVMKRQGGGSILFISSMSAMTGMTQVTAYGAAKSAVLGLVKSLTGEFAPWKIRVNAISPGFIDTPMFRQATDADPDRQKKILGHTPMGEYGSPEDIGWAAVYLCSDAARFVTGVNLPVDGGFHIGF